MNFNVRCVEKRPNISSVWGRMKMFFAGIAGARRWRGFCPLPHLWA